MMKTYVLYHSGCWDGFCAAWVANGCLTGQVEFIPVQYSQKPPVIEPKSRLYILDFSYPRDQLFKWWTPGPNAVERLVVLDHHKTAKEDLEGFDDDCLANGMDCPIIVFDMNKSGARLTWEHFYNESGIAVPWLVDYTEDRDLWRWKLMESKAVNAALRSYPLEFKVWDQLLTITDPINTMAHEGWAILRREKQIVDSHVKFAKEITMDGYNILAVNATVLSSEIAGELAKGRPFGACWFEDSSGSRVWSLRSDDNGVDVSAIAKAHGGGGHYHASGFKQ